MQIPPETWKNLSHKQRRTLISKERRRRKRTEWAIEKEAEQAALESQPEYIEKLVEEERQREEQERKEEARRQLENDAWLKRERVAQAKFKKEREREEAILREREERERLIREEWEALERKEREEEEKRGRARREKEEKLKEALSVGERPQAEPWHNPLAPDDSSNSVNYGTEKDTVNCAFFLKTGACRFGDRCSRQHPRPSSSTTLLIPGMYSSLGFAEQMLDEADHDVALEYDEGELYGHFKEFYEDVLPEFSRIGKVVQFKVSCNYEPHLRGNVYVQFSTEDECVKAYGAFNGRWYAQRQLSCEFCPVQKWKTAICGLSNYKRCPKGKHCNFLHVFRNPGGAFSRADQDMPSFSPPPEKRRYSRDRDRSYRRGSRHRSRNRDRHRSRSRERHRSRSRERRRSNTRERRRSKSRERHRSRSRERHRSRSRERHRSNSRERHRSKSRERHRSRSRDRHRSRSRENRSRSRSVERHGKRRERRRARERDNKPRSRSRSSSRQQIRSQRSRSKEGRKHSGSPASESRSHSRSPRRTFDSSGSKCPSPRETEKKKKKRKHSRSRSRLRSNEEHSSPLTKKHKRKKSHGSNKTKKKRHHNSGSDTDEDNDVRSRKEGNGECVEEANQVAVLPDSSATQLCIQDSLTNQVSSRLASACVDDDLRTAGAETPGDLKCAKQPIDEAGIVSIESLGMQQDGSLATTSES